MAGKHKGILSGMLDKPDLEEEVYSAVDDDRYEVLYNIKGSKTYTIPALVDAVLEIMKSKDRRYKGDILTDIILNSASEEEIKKAKEIILRKNGIE